MTSDDPFNPSHYTKDLKALAASEPDPKKRQEIESQDRFITGYSNPKVWTATIFPTFNRSRTIFSANPGRTIIRSQPQAVWFLAR